MLPPVPSGELALEADVDLRGLLERAVMGRCTLTVGDEVRVAWGGKEYPLRVVEVAPDDAGGAVSLIEVTNLLVPDPLGTRLIG
jgi:hypothetical protein